MVVVVAALGSYIFLKPNRSEAPSNSSPVSTQPVKDKSTPDPKSVFNKNTYSIEQPDSLWVIVNKKRPLPSDYAPADLIDSNIGGQFENKTSKAFDELVSAATKEGVNFKLISSYRSYANQQSTYNGYVASNGQAKADTFSARPGHSEHQTGLAADIGNSNGSCDLDVCFGETPGGKWLVAHAHEHGFIIRYPSGKESVTGYQPEPWHIRYVGKELAGELFRSGQTMEEFFNLPPAPTY